MAMLVNPPNPFAGCMAGAASHEQEMDEALKDIEDQEAKNRPNIPLKEKFHRALLEGVRNVSDT